MREGRINGIYFGGHVRPAIREENSEGRCLSATAACQGKAFIGFVRACLEVVPVS